MISWMVTNEFLAFVPQVCRIVLIHTVVNANIFPGEKIEGRQRMTEYAVATL